MQRLEGVGVAGIFIFLESRAGFRIASLDERLLLLDGSSPAGGLVCWSGNGQSAGRKVNATAGSSKGPQLETITLVNTGIEVFVMDVSCNGGRARVFLGRPLTQRDAILLEQERRAEAAREENVALQNEKLRRELGYPARDRRYI